MDKRNRVFAGIVLATLLGVGWLIWSLLRDIDPRYRESAEESLVEVSQLVATLVEQQLTVQVEHDGSPLPDAEPLARLFHTLYGKRFDAQIYSVHKTRVELRVIVTDRAGTVVFDSLGRELGADHSQWREIARSLRGEYGARTTTDVPGDPSSAVMYVGAPVRVAGDIVGAVSVGKPEASFGQFVEAARRKTVLVGLSASVATVLLILLTSAWLVRPFGVVGDVLRQARRSRRLSVPQLARSLAGAVQAAFAEMRDALAGRNYVADYVQTLTHEVKSPLSAIRGAAELLQEPSMPATDRARFASNIERETQRIQELVDRMMELAEIESRAGLANPEPVALLPLLEEVAASGRASGAARGIGVLLEVDAGAVEPPPVVDGDPLLLRRALSNLIDNAIDFSPDGNAVTVLLCATPRMLEVRVRDCGPGIPPYAADKVFEKFYSLARPHSRKKSTGLGLSFVREIAKLHGGRVGLANVQDGPGAQAVLALRRGGR